MKKTTKKKTGFGKSLLIIICITAFTLFLLPGIFENLKFGLDLQGGFEVLYQVESIDGKEVTSDMVESTYKTMLKRIDVLGVSEPVITVEGEDKIRVQLAGVTDQEEARKILSSAATLTFRDSNDNLLMNSDVLSKASVGTDSKGLPAVALSIKDTEQFYKVTKKISGLEDNLIVIWLDFEEGVDSFAQEQNNCGSLNDSRCLSAATVTEGFASDVIIQGSFTQEEVKTLVDLINSGSLPTKLTEISSKTVAASFGENSLQQTFIAGVIGFVLVVILMVALYRFAGFISAVGLLIYTALTFGIFWLVGGVLTLPGIAAILLGIGMAVDANVINFARIKDELKSGSSFQSAFKKGNHNSLMTIIDANLTTLIVAVILFIFGESSIKGFATMLIISTFVTMLVMVVFTRVLLKMFVQTGYFDDKVTAFVGKINKDKKPFSFINKSNIFMIITILYILIGIISLGVQQLNLGIDFKGGSSITIQASEKITIKDVEKDLKTLELDVVSKEQLDDSTIYLKVENSLNQDNINEIQEYFSEKYEASTDIGVVSNMVKKELIKNAILSVLISAIGIILYVSVRFKFSYGISSIIALLHDVFVIIAVFSICRLEVSTIFIAALLSIIGYSINDTIVVFDRIRENLDKKCKGNPKNKEELKEVVDLSLNQTIKRSIITSVTTIIPVLCLILFGSHEIFNFNIALLIGLLAGTYSSIFIASQIWFKIEQKNIGKPKKKKWYEIDEVEEKKVKGINS